MADPKKTSHLPESAMIYSSNCVSLPGPGDLPARRFEYFEDAPEGDSEDPRFTRYLEAIQSGMSVLEYCRIMGESPEDLARLLTEFGVNLS